MNLKAVMHNEAVCQVNTMLTLLEGSLMLGDPSATAAAGGPSAVAITASHMERVFLFCLTWSLGGLLHERDRPTFDAELRTLAPTDLLPPKVRHPGTLTHPPTFFFVIIIRTFVILFLLILCEYIFT